MLYFGFVYLFMLTFFGHRFKKSTRYLLVSFPFLLIIFLRFGVGADYFSYENIYGRVDPSSIFTTFKNMKGIDILYILLNFIATKLGLSYHIFAGIMASILIIMTLKWLYDNSPYFELSALLHYSILFIYWNISALRQGIVITVLLFIYFNRKVNLTSRKKAIISLIFAFMHPTSIIVPVFYQISQYDWDIKKYMKLLVGVPFARLIAMIIVKSDVLVLFSRTGIRLVNKVISYSRHYNGIKLLSSPSLMRLSFYLFILYHYKRLVEKYPGYKNMFNFSLLSLIFYFYMPTAMVVGTRTTIFGYYLILIIFPMIMSLYDDKRLRNLIFVGLLGFSLVSSYNELSKLVDRTGYEGSLYDLNFETIFKGNRINFANKYALDYMVNEENERVIESNPLLKRTTSDNLQLENNSPGDLRQISVYFSAYDRYGAIDENARITKMPTTIGRIINYKFKYADHNLIGMIRTKRSPDWLERFPSFNRFNMNAITKVSTYKKSFDEYAYLRITGYRHYFIILKNGEILIDRFYVRVDPFNEHGFAVGYTTKYREIINTEGEVLWIEPR